MQQAEAWIFCQKEIFPSL